MICQCYGFVGRLPIYTGLQHLVLLPDQPYGMPLKYPALPQKLKDVGYSTHMVGELPFSSDVYK